MNRIVLIGNGVDLAHGLPQAMSNLLNGEFQCLSRGLPEQSTYRLIGFEPLDERRHVVLNHCDWHGDHQEHGLS